MIPVVCADDALGMRFNGRRQSRDRAVTARLLARTAGGRLWIYPCSRVLFAGCDAPQLREAEDALALAGPGEYCFVEDRDLAEEESRMEALILYRWNRRYPADLRLALPLGEGGWRLVSREELPGYSHEIITEEVYRHA